jgi:hypothetical protein
MTCIRRLWPATLLILGDGPEVVVSGANVAKHRPRAIGQWLPVLNESMTQSPLPPRWKFRRRLIGCFETSAHRQGIAEMSKTGGNMLLFEI